MSSEERSIQQGRCISRRVLSASLFVGFLLSAWMQSQLACYLVHNDSINISLGKGPLRFVSNYAETIHFVGMIPLMVIGGLLSFAVITVIEVVTSDR